MKCDKQKGNGMVEEALKEKNIHGTKEFPLQVYQGKEFHKNGVMLHVHWHEEIEIMIVTKGKLEVIINGESIIASRNTIFLIPPNVLHGGYQTADKEGDFTSIVFHPDFICSKEEDFIQEKYVRPLLEPDVLSYYMLSHADLNTPIVSQAVFDFEQIYYKNMEYKELFLKGYLLQILAYMLLFEEKNSNKKEVSLLLEKRKKKVLIYIEENYQDPLSLSELAKSIALSKEQFCRFFKQSFHTTPMNYVNQYRILQAVKYLENTDLPVTQIGLKVGFDSSTYFSVVFKKVTGKNPREFRKMT